MDNFFKLLYSLCMPKIDYRRLSPHDRRALLQEWQSALQKLPSKPAVITFLSNALTQSEQVMLARRIRVARALLQGKPFHGIKKDLGAGIQLIRETDRWLSELYPDYRLTIPPLLEHTKKKHPKREYVPLDPYTFRELRAKYPIHFLFFNLLLGNPRS